MSKVWNRMDMNMNCSYDNLDYYMLGRLLLRLKCDVHELVLYILPCLFRF